MTLTSKAPPRWPRRVIITGTVIVLLALALWMGSMIARPALPTYREVTAQAKAQAALTGGEKVFVAHCASCHATGIGPSLADKQLPLETITAFVRTGPGAMPAFPPSQVSDADIVALAEYVSNLPAPAESKP